MIAAFEQRLADVVGARLPVPFRGRVRVAPFGPPTANPALAVAVVRAEPDAADFGSRRPEIAPNVADPRRVLRLRCEVRIDVLAAVNAGRAQQMEGLDALLFALDADDIRTGVALRADGDPGFLVSHVILTGFSAPLDPAADDAGPFGVTLQVTGWFWPAGTPGQAGRVIGEVRVRGAVLPLTVTAGDTPLVAGGPAVDLVLRFGAAGTMASDGTNVTTQPFGRLVVLLEAPGGRPGTGSLSGGAVGDDGARRLIVRDGETTVRYTPPAEPGVDELIVAIDDGDTGPGLELGRFPLVTRAG